MANPSPEKRSAAVRPTPAEAILCEDLILEILSKLPTPALCPLNRVCKRWRRRLIPSILRNRPNLALIRIQHTKPHLACFTHDGAVRKELCFHSLFHFFPHRLLNVCNGMALARTRPPGYYRLIDSTLAGPRDDDCDFVVINTVTGESCFVPPPLATPFPRPRSYMYINILAFDPRCSPGHFKLFVWMRSMLGLKPTAAFLYSSLMSQWRRLDESAAAPPHFFGLVFNDASHCFNGRAYRVAESVETRVMNVRYLRVWIAVFDVNEEAFTWIESPKAAIAHPIHGHEYSLGESGGCLSYAYRDAMLLSIWVLIKDDEWSLRYNVDIGSAYPHSWPKFYSLAFHPQDPDVVFLTKSEKTLFVLDLKALKIHEFCELGDEGSPWLALPFLCFRELASCCPISSSCKTLQDC